MTTHLGETYHWFINEGCTITVNGDAVTARWFETWAFPTGFAPHSAVFEVEVAEGGKIAVAITAGLIRDRVPEEDNYGVYFYCNHRLIVKELRTREVGYFVTSEAGVPHPDASLCRAIVRLQGPARLMPWNSTKNGINFGQVPFQHVRPTLIPLVSHFSKLSRRLKNDWDREVYRHNQARSRRSNLRMSQARRGSYCLLSRAYESLRSSTSSPITRNKFTTCLGHSDWWKPSVRFK